MRAQTTGEASGDTRKIRECGDMKGSPRTQRGARGYKGEPEVTKGSPRIRGKAQGYKGKVKEGVHEGREVKPHWDEVQQADDPMGIDLAAADVAERTRRR